MSSNRPNARTSARRSHPRSGSVANQAGASAQASRRKSNARRRLPSRGTSSKTQHVQNATAASILPREEPRPISPDLAIAAERFRSAFDCLSPRRGGSPKKKMARLRAAIAAGPSFGAGSVLRQLRRSVLAAKLGLSLPQVNLLLDGDSKDACAWREQIRIHAPKIQ